RQPAEVVAPPQHRQLVRPAVRLDLDYLRLALPDQVERGARLALPQHRRPGPEPLLPELLRDRLALAEAELAQEAQPGEQLACLSQRLSAGLDAAVAQAQPPAARLAEPLIRRRT